MLLLHGVLSSNDNLYQNTSWKREDLDKNYERLSPKYRQNHRHGRRVLPNGGLSSARRHHMWASNQIFTMMAAPGGKRQ